MVYVEKTAGGGKGSKTEDAVEEVEGGSAPIVSKSEKMYYVGDSIAVRRDHFALESPFKDGLVSDWESTDRLWRHGFATLAVDPKEHGILMVEPVYNKRVIREKHAEIVFETYESPSFFVSKSAALCCYANARGTGAVYDSGGGSTTSCTVADGYVVQKSIVRNQLCGRILDEAMLSAVQKYGNAAAASLRPRYVYTSTKQADASTRIEPTEFPDTHPSYRKYMSLEIGRSIRESLCRCSEKRFDVARSGNIPTVPYKLPDRSIIDVGVERFLIPEIMFNQDVFDSRYDFLPAHTMLCSSIEKSGEMRIRKDLFNNIIVAGGNTCYEGFTDRLHQEIRSRVSRTMRTKVLGGTSTGHRNVSAWCGGSILASLDSFSKMWISKSEYEEHGSSITDRKCP